jgi:hypothetical protein
MKIFLVRLVIMYRMEDVWCLNGARRRRSFVCSDLMWCIVGFVHYVYNPGNASVVESVEIMNKMQPCNRIYYSKIYRRLNMFWAAYRSSSGAPNCICSLWFIYPCGDWPLSRLVTTGVFKPDAANTVWSSWWWLVCRSKHVETSLSFGINSITRLHLVGYFYWFILRCTDPRI